MNCLLIACSDGRVAPALDALQTRLHIEDADRLLLPGGPRPSRAPAPSAA